MINSETCVHEAFFHRFVVYFGMDSAKELPFFIK